MYNQPTNDAMMTRNTFILPAQIEGDFSAEELSEDMDGVTLRFPRAKIPGGGTIQFELTGENPDEPEYTKSIEGVLMFTHLANAYWPEGSEYDDDAPPLCQSVDGKTGSGTPGGMCQDCLLNRFGSDSKGGNGKACKNMRMLYILRSGESLPIQLALPPTSLKGYNDFVSAAFLSRKRGTTTLPHLASCGQSCDTSATPDCTSMHFLRLRGAPWGRASLPTAEPKHGVWRASRGIYRPPRRTTQTHMRNWRPPCFCTIWFP